MKVILDITGIYPIADNYIAITNEVEWLRLFAQDDSNYWILGEKLCRWTREWLRVWDKTDVIIEEKQKPRSRLVALFPDLQIPPQWDEKIIFDILSLLDSYPQDNPLAYFLSFVSETDVNLWLEKPSINHLAWWLSVEIPLKYQPLEKLWVNQTIQSNPALAIYYQTEDKLLLLKQWLGLAQPPVTLNIYPSKIPDFVRQEFETLWDEKIIISQGKVINNLIPSLQHGMREIANCAYNIFKDNPDWITKQSLVKLSPYLTPQQRHDLNSFQLPPTQTSAPELSSDLIQEIVAVKPIFWVIIDSITWSDSQEFLDILTENNTLTIETEIKAKFTCLPELNEPIYTDSNKYELTQALKENKHQIYCWHTEQLKHIYEQKQPDWQNFTQVQRPHTLQGIVKDIEYFVKQYPYPEKLKVAISTTYQVFILQKVVKRYPVLVTCQGEGKAKQTGFLQVTIHNPNSVALTDLCLYVNEIPELKTGVLLDVEIPAKNKITHRLNITEFPKLDILYEDNKLDLTGELSFRYYQSEFNTVSLRFESRITIKQMFVSGFNIDELL